MNLVAFLDAHRFGCVRPTARLNAGRRREFRRANGPVYRNQEGG